MWMPLSVIADYFYHLVNVIKSTQIEQALKIMGWNFLIFITWLMLSF